MDRITVTGIEVFAHHGVLTHERELGQRFVVDVVIHLDLSAAAASDQLADTVDYGAVAVWVQQLVGSEPAALIEVVASRVCDHVLADDRVHGVDVTVHKPNAPLGVPADEVSVTLQRRR